MEEVVAARVEHDVEAGVQRFITTIVGRPLPLRRSVFVKRVRRAVNPSHREQQHVRELLRKEISECGSSVPFVSGMEKSVKIKVTFRCRRPNNHFYGGDRKRSVREVNRNTRHTCGDIDNLVKFVLDAGNAILFEDDRQVCDLTATILWHEDPTSEGSTTISVEETVAL